MAAATLSLCSKSRRHAKPFDPATEPNSVGKQSVTSKSCRQGAASKSALGEHWVPQQRDLGSAEDLKRCLTLPGAAELGSTTKAPRTSLPGEEELLCQLYIQIFPAGETAAIQEGSL